MTNQQIYDLILNILTVVVIFPFFGLFFTKEAKEFIKDSQAFWSGVFSGVELNGYKFGKTKIKNFENIQIHLDDDLFESNKNLSEPIKQIFTTLTLSSIVDMSTSREGGFQIRFGISST